MSLVLPEYRPLRDLKLREVTENSVLLKARNGFLQVGVLAPDLFRLRSSTTRFAERVSWVVCKTEWPKTPVQVESTPGKVQISTASANIAIELGSGGWTFRQAHGEEAFSSMPKLTGFSSSSCQLTLGLKEGESLFGLGETTGTFNKRGLIREFWNIDVLGHAPAIHPSLRTLYVSIPFALSLWNGRAAGMFWDNPARQTWDLGQTKLNEWRMKAGSGEMDLYLFAGRSVAQVISRFTELTGRIPLPPRWALGNQQCRYSYETRERVEEVAREFRARRIPCDALYLDIHHMDGYRVFTFGKSFPKPGELCARLRQQGFKVVTIVDPGVKNDRSFGVLKRGIKAHAFVKKAAGKGDFIGRVWPGESRFPDLLNQRTRAWWGREQARLFKLGVAGIWNDMNEPANFALPSKTLPEDCIHESDCGPVTHAEAHNVYGMQMARASREGALKARPNERPFIITRAGYAGVQRYALVWTGDNSSVWEHLADAVQMYLNLGISGSPFCGGDVGGFLDNTTPELLARWTQMAVFTPFLRNHSNIRTVSQEPWAFGEPTESICRRHIELRYQLLPYFYCLFAEARRTGAPIMRPLYWHYQQDRTAVGISDQFLLGRDLLVAPIVRQGAVARGVYLPQGSWYNFWTGERHRGEKHVIAEAPLDIIPLFVRAGAIIPMTSVRQFVPDQNPSALALHLWPGGSGELAWYEDDGRTLEHLRGDFHERQIAWKQRGKTGELEFSKARGRRKTDTKRWRVIVHGLRRPPSATLEREQYLARACGTKTWSFEAANSAEEMTVQLRC